MSKKTDITELAEMPLEEIEERLALAHGRIQERIKRCEAEQRDLSAREADLCGDDRLELGALRDALQLRTRNAEQSEKIGRALEQAVRSSGRDAWQPTLLVSEQHLDEHAAALREGRPYGAVEVESRARVTAAADLGSAGAWDPGQPNEPRHLIRFAPLPVSELTGRTAQVPAYTGPTAAAGVDENTAHGEYDSIAPINLTGLRYGRWSDVSALANAVDDLRGVMQMHAWGIARDLDELAVTAVEAAAGAPAAAVDLEQQVREAILSVAAATYSDESALVLVGTPADLSLLVGTTPANAADLGSVPVRFNGAKIYPTTAATAGQVTVLAPSSFRVFQTRLQSSSLIDPTDGSNKFGSWLHSTGVAQQIVGSAAAVDTTT